jgi:uncharacterized phage protein gp47/JayE
MPFSARTAATIRDVLLGRWRARYLALTPPRDLSITEGSDAYNLADAFAHELAGLELGAQQAAMRVLLRTSSGADLDRFAEDDGTARRAATTSRLNVRVSGPLTSTTPVNGATLATAAGLRFTPINATTGAALTSIDTDGAGVADITVQAVDAGAAGNLAAGTVLTWSSAPTGFAATGSVTSSARAGQNAEGDATLRQRLLERLREKPGGFNRSQIRELGILYAGVGECFVYPRAWRMLASGATYGWPGVVTVMPVNPAPAEDSYTQSGTETGQGLSSAYSRVPNSGFAGQVLAYFKGERDATGMEVADAQRVELIPATMLPSDVYVLPPEAVVVDVTVRVTLDSAVANWPWGVASPASRGVTASSTTWMDLDNVAGIAAAQRIAVFIGTNRVRGGWWLATVAGAPVGNRVTFAAALPSAPEIGAGNARPDPGLWDAIRRAVLMLFDALGPGDARTGGSESGGLIAGGTVSVQSARYPRPTSSSSPEMLFPSKIAEVAQGVDGVLGVEVVTPAATSTPAPGRLLVPGKFRIEPPA